MRPPSSHFSTSPPPQRRSLEALAALHLPKSANSATGASGASGAPAFAEPAHAAPPMVERLRALATSMPAMLAIIAIAIGTAIFLFMSDFDSPAPEAAPPEAPAAGAPPAPAASAPALPGADKPLPPGIVFTPADKSFTVSVPGMPEELELTPEQVEQMGELRMHQYKLVTDHHIYTMQATDYGARVPESIGAAMDGMQASIVGKDGTLVKVTPIALRGGSGREVRVQLANGAVRAARFAFVGSKFSMVAVVAANGKQSAPEIDAFLHSFQLN